MKEVRSLIKSVPLHVPEEFSEFKKLYRSRPEETLFLEEDLDWWDITNMLFDAFEDRAKKDLLSEV